MEKAVNHFTFFSNEKIAEKAYPAIMINLINKCILYPCRIFLSPSMLFLCEKNDKKYYLMLNVVEPVVKFYKYGYVNFIVIVMEVIHVYKKKKEQCCLTIPMKWDKNGDEKNVEIYLVLCLSTFMCADLKFQLCHFFHKFLYNK